MVKFDNKVELSGLIVLFIGVILLIFTFIGAYLFLIGDLNIIATDDLLNSFGEALAPLIEAIVRVLFLGIMGWIGSIVTIRAVQLLKQEGMQTTSQGQAQGQQSVRAESKQSVPEPAPAAPSPSSPPAQPSGTQPEEAKK